MNEMFIFIAGATVGSVITWKLVKTKYERIAQEEIDSVKEVFSRKGVTETADTDIEQTYINDSIQKAADISKKFGYSVYSKKEEMEEDDVSKKPYIISPEELGEDYEVESLNLYADGILTDDRDNVIAEDDIEEIVGKDSLTHFGEYEDDSVFVRNEALELDYEILLDTRNYYDIYPKDDK